MCEVWWAVKCQLYYKFTAESAVERTMKIEQCLVQLLVRIGWFPLYRA